MSRLAAPFTIRSFRFQWPADLLTSWAFEMETLMLGWYILVETGSVLLLTLFAALQYGGTLIAPVLGVASDRVGHRNLMVGMRTVYATVAATLMLLALAGALTPFLVCILAALTGLVRPSDLGLRGALIAESMPFGLLTGAMGISRATSDSARVAGALAGAGMFAAFGIGPAYMAVTGFYVLGALLTLGVEASHPETSSVPAVGDLARGSSTWRDVRAGLTHVWNTPRLLALVWLAFLFNLTAFPLTQGLLPYVAKNVYHVDETGLGYLVASFAFGALLGSIALGRVGTATRLARLMVVSAVAWYVLLLMFAQMRSLPGGIAVLVLAGFAQSLCMVSHTVILLRDSDQRIRGRVMGVRMLAIYSLPVGMLAAGALIERIGFGATASLYAVMGLGLIAFTAWCWRNSLWRSRPPEDGA